jgi:DNA primase
VQAAPVTVPFAEQAPARNGGPVDQRESKADGHPSLAASSSEAASLPVSPSLVLPPPLAATAKPAPASAVNDARERVFQFGDRSWRVRSTEAKAAVGQLRVNLLVRRATQGGFFVDTVELYSSKHRAAYVRQAAEELELEERILKKELGDILLALESDMEAAEKAREAEANGAGAGEAMTEERRAAALKLLRDPGFLLRVVSDLSHCGLVGEDDNKLLAYLAVTSRKLEAPLAIVVQSTSAAGKSSLMDAVLALVPEEERVQYSAMTGQSLYYMGKDELRHKVLAIAEEEGATRASYALKLLQSEGSLTIASTGKDPVTGKLITHAYEVTGPVMIFLTTTAIDLDEELLNRCMVLTVDEGQAQTKAIHQKQRESQTLEGLLAQKARSGLRELHQDAQRLLEPLLVANPYVHELSFVDHATRTRRDHMKYLTLIRTVALLHQHQRERKVIERDGATAEYIEVTRADIEVADRLMASVLRRSLDELPPVTRTLLGLLTAWAQTHATAAGLELRDFRFTRRQVREALGWSQTQLLVHLGRLEAHEHIAAWRSGGGPGISGSQQGQRALYSMVHEAIVSASTTSQSHGYGVNLLGSYRGGIGPLSGSYRGVADKLKGQETESETRLSGPSHGASEKVAAPGQLQKIAS